MWTASAQTVTFDFGAAKPISPLIMGISHEDLSYAADGGLYAELIENRSFDYSPSERKEWLPLSFWHLEKRSGAEGEMISETAEPIHPNNPLYLVLGVKNPGDGLGIINYGFGGIPVKQGKAIGVAVSDRPTGPFKDARLRAHHRRHDPAEYPQTRRSRATMGMWTRMVSRTSPNRTSAPIRTPRMELH